MYLHFFMYKKIVGKNVSYICIKSFIKFCDFLALKFLYFTKLVWHHLIKQSFSFQNLFYKLRYD